MERSGLLGWCQCMGTKFGMEVAYSPVIGRDAEIGPWVSLLSDCLGMADCAGLLPGPHSLSISLCYLPRPAY